MYLFYYPDSGNGTIRLDKTESSHCIRVLRLSAGDNIHLTDGKGKILTAKIIKADKNACVAEVVESVNVPRERDFQISIAIAPTKSNERFEWFLEKVTEIGVDTIIPILCSNSERRVLKPDRLEKVLISAVKQSLKAWIPDIEPMISFKDLVSKPFSGSQFIATTGAPPENHLSKLYQAGTDCLVVIGPEGDFTSEELSIARSLGIRQVSLGNSRLRTETAGIVACHSIHLKGISG